MDKKEILVIKENVRGFLRPLSLEEINLYIKDKFFR